MGMIPESHSAGETVIDYQSQSLEEYSSKWDLQAARCRPRSVRMSRASWIRICFICDQDAS